MAAIRTAWEQDLNYTFTEDVWDSVLDRVHSSSMCSRHALLQFKVVHHIHISKTKLARMYPNVDPTCDKCRGAPASLHHMYLTCPSLSNFWSSVFYALSETLQHQIQLNPLTGIFGIAPDLDLPKAMLNFLAFASLLAGQTISLKWRDSAPPSYSHWLRDMISCMNLEKIRHTLRGSEKKILQYMAPLLCILWETFDNSYGVAPPFPPLFFPPPFLPKYGC